MTAFAPPPTQLDPLIHDPATDSFVFNPVWMQWFINLAAFVTASGGGGGGAVNHESLAGLLGGSAGQHYHTDNTQYTELVGNKTANQVYASPSSGGAAAPAFRALVTADLPAGTGTVTSVATGTGLTGGPITTTGTISMASVIVAGGPTGSASVTPIITYNAEGQLTAVSSATITPAAIGAPSGSGTSTGSNTGDQTITLTSEATGSGTGSFAVTLSNAAVIGKVLTGYVAGAGVVAATDTILQAIEKLDGNITAAAVPPGLQAFLAAHG